MRMRFSSNASSTWLRMGRYHPGAPAASAEAPTRTVAPSAVAQAPGHARLQREELDEAGRGRLREEPSRLREGCELGVIESGWRAAPDHARMPLVQLESHLT